MPPLGQFGPRAPDTAETTDQELLLNATVEPDLDGDDRGDETQDNCPESPDPSDRPCTIDVTVEPPIGLRVFIGFDGGQYVRLLWKHDPNLFNWVPAEAMMTIDAPPHAPITGAGAGGIPCEEVTPQRAVCRVRMPPFLFGQSTPTSGVSLLTRVDPRTVSPALARSGARFTVSIAPSGRDLDAGNNRAEWSVEIAAPACYLPLRGARRADRIRGTEHGDRISGGRGNDVLIGNGGRDCFEGGRGNDRLVANDGRRERVDCGPGPRDRAVVDRVDRILGCEIVRRRAAS
jgi:hypothetical protein